MKNGAGASRPTRVAAVEGRDRPRASTPRTKQVRSPWPPRALVVSPPTDHLSDAKDHCGELDKNTGGDESETQPSALVLPRWHSGETKKHQEPRQRPIVPPSAGGESVSTRSLRSFIIKCRQAIHPCRYCNRAHPPNEAGKDSPVEWKAVKRRAFNLLGASCLLSFAAASVLFVPSWFVMDVITALSCVATNE
jgi:hypothetical protein